MDISNESIGKKRHPKRKRRVITVIVVILAVIVTGGSVYLNTSYPASDDALLALESDDYVTVTQMENGYYVFQPGPALVDSNTGDGTVGADASSYDATTSGADVSPTSDPQAETASATDGLANEASKFSPDAMQCGVIFYPGGKVDQAAYAPLMREFAERGFTVVLVKFPFNLAVFNVGAADGIEAQFPQIGHWYIGGHSLGGAMAAQYASDHSGDIEGLLLCAAYSTEDLSGTELQVVSVYGSCDGVLNMQSYEKDKPNIPQTEEDVIEGGCHSYFGDYGMQDGDGTPTITREQQMSRTADDLLAMAAA